MKTVLVTGSEGNLGPYIVSALRARQPDWTILRVKNSKEAPIFSTTNDRYEGDLRDERLMQMIQSSHNIDLVIHAASTSYSHVGYGKSQFSVLENDCSIFLNVLRHARGVEKIVLLSSALLYEHATSSPLSEETSQTIPAPSSSYGAAKHFGEKMLQLFHAQHGVKFTIWRPFNVVSPLEPTDGDGRHVFVDFFRRLYLDRVAQFRVLGSGNQVRCFIWVEDAADCIVTNLEQPGSDNQTFNLARDEPITLLDLKDLLLDIGKRRGSIRADYDPPTVRVGGFAGVESEVRIPSVSKLKGVLRWESSIPVCRCFEKFVDHKLQVQ